MSEDFFFSFTTSIDGHQLTLHANRNMPDDQARDILKQEYLRCGPSLQGLTIDVRHVDGTNMEECHIKRRFKTLENERESWKAYAAAVEQASRNPQ